MLIIKCRIPKPKDTVNPQSDAAPTAVQDPSKPRATSHIKKGRRHFNQVTVQLESPAASDQKEKEFLCKIQEILSCPLPAYEAPSFEFQMDKFTAATNWKMLQQHNGDLKQALAAQSHSQLGYYGSEFRPTEILEPLF
eukprot:scaffold162830_cov52-Attheya_sp.AAC.12